MSCHCPGPGLGPAALSSPASSEACFPHLTAALPGQLWHCPNAAIITFLLDSEPFRRAAAPDKHLAHLDSTAKTQCCQPSLCPPHPTPGSRSCLCDPSRPPSGRAGPATHPLPKGLLQWLFWNSPVFMPLVLLFGVVRSSGSWSWMLQVQDPLCPLLCDSEQGTHFSVPGLPLPEPPRWDSVSTRHADICPVCSTWKGPGGCCVWASLSLGEVSCWLAPLQTGHSGLLVGRLQEVLSKLN